MPIYLQLDEPTLREVARMTGGDYHQAGTAEKLRSVYENMGSQLLVSRRETELSGLISLVSALFAIAGGTLSVLWFGRMA
jgi:Ca-activated chloride channel family protein